MYWQRTAPDISYMQKIKFNIHKILLPLLAALSIVSVSLTLSTPALAASDDSPWTYEDSGVTQKMLEYRSRISRMYAFVQAMAAPFALLAVGGGALSIFFGKDPKRGTEIIKIAFAALMALYLLPLFISAGYYAVSNTGVAWNPENPDFVW